ncbi:kinase-like domain-containing protein [Rhizophagus diaphanus]|nr:kinase-like domain-containing protein [Rhizophagus diaphanus] [Rhizophagus sp. MUCL 43196]
MQSTGGYDLIKDIIFGNNIKYYKYKNFYNVEKIDENTYLANWNYSEQRVILKSFNLENASVNKEEIINELKFHKEVTFHKNMIKLFGITDKSNDQMREYLLIMEYTNGGSLRNYLKENLNNLTFKDRYELAYQLACAVLLLNNKGILHLNLHPGNIYINQNTIKLSNFGLLSRTKRAKSQLESFYYMPYLDPKRYSSNEKDDTYSIGALLLWELSSGQPSLTKDKLYDDNLIKQGYKEQMFLDTPVEYSNLYIDCLNNEPNHRPTMIHVVDRLKVIIANYYETEHEMCSHNMQHLNNIGKKEVELTTQDTNNLNYLIDGLFDIYFEKMNEGNNKDVLKKYVFDYFDHYKINPQEAYHFLSKNQDNSKFICLLGYFNHHGIGTDINKQKAFELNKKAAMLGNDLALFHLYYSYFDGEGCNKNYNIVLRISGKLAEKGYSNGLNSLGYCYCIGVATKINNQKAFDLFQRAADLGNIKAIYNLAVMYHLVEEINDEFKTFELSKKSAERGCTGGIMMLGKCYQLGIGVNVDMQKAFEYYQIAANLGNVIAQERLKEL